MLAQIEQLAPAGPRTGAFADEVSVHEDADDSPKLLARTGGRV